MNGKINKHNRKRGGASAFRLMMEAGLEKNKLKRPGKKFKLS